VGQQWEYCVVTYAADDASTGLSVAYLEPNTADLFLAPRQLGAIFHALGLANWELVGAVSYSVASTSFYFKRPVEPDRKIDEPKLAL
jgi:hypothetical protein